MQSRVHVIFGCAFCMQLTVAGVDRHDLSAYAANNARTIPGNSCSDASGGRELYETVCERVVSLIIDHLGVDRKIVLPRSNIVDDLGADSLDCVELVMAVEATFSIAVTDAEAEKTLTVGDIVTLVLDKGGGTRSQAPQPLPTAPQGVIKVTSGEELKAAIAKDPIVVVFFWAEWCGPCKLVEPALDEIATELGGKVKLAKLNIDENPELATEFEIRSIPALMIFKGGEKADVKVGAAPKKALSHWIRGYL